MIKSKKKREIDRKTGDAFHAKNKIENLEWNYCREVICYYFCRPLEKLLISSVG